MKVCFVACPDDAPRCECRARFEEEMWLDEMERQRHEHEMRELERQAMEEHFRQHPHG